MTTQQRSFFSDAPSPQSLVVADPGTPSSIKLSEPVKLDLSVYRGDSGQFRITVKDSDDSPIDISAATWDADIRLAINNPDIIASFEIVPVIGDISSIDVILSATNSELLSASCFYDVEMTLSGQVTTLVKGQITVTQDVSRS